MKEIFSQILQHIASEQDQVLVSVIASSGSTPRGAGARMLVSKAGRVAGTVGGGAVEFQAILLAQTCLSRRSSTLHDYKLCPNEIEDIGMICGGEVRLHFTYLAWAVPELKQFAQFGLELLAERRQAYLVLELSAVERPVFALWTAGQIYFAWPSQSLPAELRDLPAALPTGKAVLEIAGRQYFGEELTTAGFVYIFGGGHVAQALVPVLAALDFACIVLEDRADFLRPELFPGAFALRQVDFTQLELNVALHAPDYACVMTRGHAYDLDLQKQLLRSPAAYIGVIGSRKKRASCEHKLRQAGFGAADLERIISPIGLPLGGETPAEIAVSIAAQLIQFRHKKA